jgi:hypothetical protein
MLFKWGDKCEQFNLMLPDQYRIDFSVSKRISNLWIAFVLSTVNMESRMESRSYTPGWEID